MTVDDSTLAKTWLNSGRMPHFRIEIYHFMGRYGVNMQLETVGSAVRSLLDEAASAIAETDSDEGAPLPLAPA
jgi:hypothetical protein